MYYSCIFSILDGGLPMRLLSIGLDLAVVEGIVG
jgi:hypothetical protein